MYSQNNHLKIQLKIWMILLLSLITLIILVGGLTRLTDSGLSITTWELFVGLIPDAYYTKNHYYQIPKIFKPTPFNLIYKRLDNKSLYPSKDNTFFSFLDFDVF